MKIIKNRIFLASICVIISAICVFSLVKTEEVETITAYQLTEDVAKGTEITSDMVESTEISSNGMSEVITDETKIVGKYASYDLISGQFIYENSVADNQSEVLEGIEKVADGQIAYSISISSLASSTSDKILSGDIVTVFVNLNGESLQPLELKYVEVLSASTSDGLEKTATSEESISTITFLVTEEQALLLNQYEYSASIHLALVHRGEDDTKQAYLDEQVTIIEELKLAEEPEVDEFVDEGGDTFVFE
ncbi:MAG: RcpC/CpaB family pilus assembly protein [Clostridia bacterium]